MKEHHVKRYLSGIAVLTVFLAGSVAQAQLLPGADTDASLHSKHELVPYYGLSFDFTMADGSGLNSVGENYRNDLAFYFEPTWNVGARFLRNSVFKTLSVGLRFGVTQNLSGVDEANFNGTSNASPQGTCSNITPSTQGGVVDPTTVGYCHPAGNNRRTDYSDLWLTFRAPSIYTIPKANISINPSIRLIFPTSLESQYATLYTSLTPGVSFGAPLPVWGKRIKIGYGISFTKNFHRDISPILAPNVNGTASSEGGNFYDGASGAGLSNFYLDPTRSTTIGALNTSYSVSNSFDGSIAFTKKLSLDVLYVLIDSWAYGQSCDVNVQGLMVDTCATGNAVAQNSGATLNRPGYRPSQVFWATISYQALDWLGISLAWINWAPRYNPDSTYRQGIISTNYEAYTTIQVGATVTIDKVASLLRKH